MIQIDGIKRQVYVKFNTYESALDIIQATNGHAEYKHMTGEISIVQIGMAGLGIKHIRVANLPPEVKDNALKKVLAPYGTVLGISEEKWARTYRYVVANGIRQVEIMLTKHVPSHIYVEGYRVLASYDRQPTTCYGCGEVGHLYPTCPTRHTHKLGTTDALRNTYAAVVAQTSTQTLEESICPANGALKNAEQKSNRDGRQRFRTLL
jgi:hypothetical protein